VAQLALAQTLKLGKLAHSVVGCSITKIEEGQIKFGWLLGRKGYSGLQPGRVTRLADGKTG
jgi:hypothetical protein